MLMMMMMMKVTHSCFVITALQQA